MVATVPSPTKNPPSSVEDYVLSFDLKAQRMKFRFGADSWLLDKFDGDWEILGCSREGRLTVRCQLMVEPSPHGNFTGYMWLADDADSEHWDEMVGVDALDTHTRLCYNRVDTENSGESHWRLRDERTGYMVTNECKDYRGIQHSNYAPWFDRLEHQPIPSCNCGACDSFRHVYHTGRSKYDLTDKVAYFAP